MTESRGNSYAVVLAAAFLLWLPVAISGGQGFSALLALAAIPAAFFAPLKKVSRVVIAVAALSLWAAVSTFWSAETGRIMSGDLTEGNFSINAAGLRVILTALAGTLVIAATLRSQPGARTSLCIIAAVLVVHGVSVLLMALYPEATLDLYEPFSDRVKEAPQNMLRFANAFLLGLPLLIGLVWHLPVAMRFILIPLFVVLATYAFFRIGTDVAVLGILLVGLATGIALTFRTSGFRILLACFAAAIVLSPLVLSTAGPAAAKSDLPLSASSKSRIWAWSLATQKIRERPLIGHGIEASKEWRDTFADQPELLAMMKESTDIQGIIWEQYRILPGHPHNMGLQLWAEAGLVGVLLGVAILLLIGWALPPPAVLGTASTIAVAGLIGASFALFSLSYSLWNEAFWANVALVAAGCVLLTRIPGKE